VTWVHCPRLRGEDSVIELLERQKRLTANQWKLICTANLADLLDFFDLLRGQPDRVHDRLRLPLADRPLRQRLIPRPLRLLDLLFDEPLDCYEGLGLPSRQGNRIMRFSPFNCYRTRDGAIVIGAGTEEDWMGLLGVIGRQDLANDANYMDRSWRVANNHVVDVIVADWTRAHTSASALRELDAADIPCAPVNGVADILKSPQLLSRGMLQPLRFPSRKDDAAALAPGFPIKFSGGDTEYRPAAMPRANNEEIYCGLLQLSLSEIEQLEKAGVI